MLCSRSPSNRVVRFLDFIDGHAPRPRAAQPSAAHGESRAFDEERLEKRACSSLADSTNQLLRASTTSATTASSDYIRIKVSRTHAERTHESLLDISSIGIRDRFFPPIRKRKARAPITITKLDMTRRIPRRMFGVSV